MKKYFYFLMVGGLSLILLLSACKDDDDELNELEEEAGGESSDVTLDFRHTQVEEWGELRKNHIEDVAEEVEDEYENVDIEVDGMDPEEAMERLQVEMRDGDLPDIFELDTFGNELEEYVEDDHLLDLTDFLEESGMKDEFLNLDDYTVDDKVYGLPFEGMVTGFYYNKEVLDELGGKPETWDEFIDVIEEGAAEDYTPLIAQQLGMDNTHLTSMFNIILQRTAGSDAMEELAEGEAEWTDDDMMAALEKFEDLVESDAFKDAGDMEDPYAEQAEMFEEGEEPSEEEQEEMAEEAMEQEQEPYKKLLDGEAMFIYDGNTASMTPDEEDEEMMGDAAYGLVGIAEEEDKEDKLDEIGFMALPEISGGSGDTSSLEADMMGGYGFNGNVSDEEEEVIYDFIEAFWSEESMDRVAEDDGMIPARRIDNVSSMDNPIQEEILDAIHEADETFGDMQMSGSMTQQMLYEDIGQELQEIAEEDEDAEHVAENLQSATENTIEETEEMEDME